IILLFARLFGMLAAKMKIPSVMGELLAGILIGPYCLGGLPLPLHSFENGLFPIVSAQTIPLDPKLYGIAIIGSIILLFISGLETDVRTFFKYSVVGTIVGIGGIVCSFICGAAVGMFALGWEFMDPRCLFLGILCTATSVGISARILSEHRAMSSPEGVTIMAAAVIDDVLGIVCLAIVVAIANVELTGTKMAWGPIMWITVKSFGIWLGVTAIGLLISRKIADFLKFFKSAKVFSVLAFGFALMLAGLFEQAGLAMIVGAFVMGLSLSKTDISFKIRSSLDPLYNFFVPIFFVVMGMLVDIRVLKDPEVLKVGLIFSFMAIIGKVVGCFFPSLLMNFNSVGALRVGVGMVPRCEVVLIIAGIAATTMMKNPELEELEKKPDAVAQIMELKTPLPHEVPIFNSKLFGIAIIMPLVTALLAPPLLSMTLAIKKKGVRKEVKDNNDTITKYTFPSEAIKLFVLNELIELLDNEGYMHSTYSKGINIIQFRRENISFTLQINGTEFIFTSAPSEVPLIKTC
ncbi:MAG: cation:proton antiporter, partial [Victivallales bacterium]|nr:cation:proton antiporter [Victivallales bacterium]